MYNVVFRTLAECVTKGAITWSSFQSKKDFDTWHDEKMRDWYEVVDQGVTDERAVELCSSSEATQAVFFSKVREVGELLRHI